MSMRPTFHYEDWAVQALRLALLGQALRNLRILDKLNATYHDSQHLRLCWLGPCYLLVNQTPCGPLALRASPNEPKGVV
jgi:hypothetical protein